MNCRPPWGSRKCGAAVEAIVCAMKDCEVESASTLDGQHPARARFWRESLLPRSELQTRLEEPEVSYCRRIQRLRADCKPNSLLRLEGQLLAGALFWRESLFTRSIPWGSQICDTVVDFSVCVTTAVRIQHRLWRDSSERERDSGANLCPPEVHCRPPWWSQM